MFRLYDVLSGDSGTRYPQYINVLVGHFVLRLHIRYGSLFRIVPPSRRIRLATLESTFISALMWFHMLLSTTLACAIDAS
ncbi:hypothetical protein SCLCIDRAFT_1088327 [Scleroderma citrinum Foug A]|uniref:Uncharacterized protein n=1 Tax=Scleroderma citrinum Foug A TaxID=1036808 RepID=A0A0C2Z9R2_9AGAM|nr:hypothetical protein SCLCIDRAFT_1088327 [Scleroderma citrinum Foug A]